MTMIKIYHNPRCSKSRETLKLIREYGTQPEIIEYLKVAPTPEELKNLCRLLGKKPIEIIRAKEKVFQELGLSLDDNRSDEEWFKILSTNPVLIERPIVTDGQRAVIGRPPEAVLELLK
ncbi:MAG: arsenate reductase (glutaredoxin) [Candidatus Dadabacteria bacterium]|nr:MAG: arsenate reductase (glutaredoxin) [Candidatus Dadabacteria bacterium]